MARSFISFLRLKDITHFILDRNLTNVRNLTDPLPTGPLSRNIRKCMLPGDTIVVKNVTVFHHLLHFKSHYRLHTGEKLFKYNECVRSFLHYSSLSRHPKTHSLEQFHKCKECGKSFLELSLLKRHYRIHTGEKPYKCEVCNKSFTWDSTLRRHQKIHTGEKPYKCLECDEYFTLHSYLIAIRKCILKRNFLNAKTVTYPLSILQVSENIRVFILERDLTNV